MGLVTAIYLIFELAFAARLLDVVGTTTDLTQIDQIERAGRLLAGVALTLVIWTTVILPRARRSSRTPWAPLFFSLIGCCAVSYIIQEGIVLGLSHGSSAEARQAATTLTLISGSVQDEDAVLDGIDFSIVDRSGPPAKTFFALLPALALSVDDLERRTIDVVDDLLEARALRTFGGREAFLSGIYDPSEVRIVDLYNAYIRIATPHFETRSQVDEAHRRLYRQYRNSLGRYTPHQIPRSRYTSVGSRVRQMGVPVPFNWDPRDEQGFRDAVEKRVMDQVGPIYEERISALFGDVLPDDLDSVTFFEHPSVQNIWRRMLGLVYEIELRPGLSAEGVIEQVYIPWVDEIVADLRPVYVAPKDAFHPESVHYGDGVRAVRTAYVPLIALVFSLLGAAVHLFKTGTLTLKSVCGGQTPARRKAVHSGTVALFILVASGLSWLSFQSNPVTQSELYISLEERTASKAGAPLAVLMRTVIQLQTYAYPVADWLRTNLLFGLTYDFDPDTSTPLFENVPSFLLYHQQN